MIDVVEPDTSQLSGDDDVRDVAFILKLPYWVREKSKVLADGGPDPLPWFLLNVHQAAQRYCRSAAPVRLQRGGLAGGLSDHDVALDSAAAAATTARDDNPSPIIVLDRIQHTEIGKLADPAPSVLD